MNKKIIQKHNDSINNKLKAYSALAAGILSFANNSEAQIIYTDLNPDVTVYSSVSYMLDLNGDGTPDFKFTHSGYGGSYGTLNSALVAPLGIGNRILDTINSANHYPPPLNLNSSIGPNPDKNHIWTNSQNNLMALNFAVIGQQFASYKGYWKGVTDKYLGLSIEVNNKTYYGWVRLDVAKNATSITIKDYAYNNIPDQKILAGEKNSTNINKNNELSLKTTIYTNNKDLFVKFNTSETIKGTINLCDLTGQLLRTKEIASDENNLKLEGITSGIYMINIQTSKGSMTKKIFIE